MKAVLSKGLGWIVLPALLCVGGPVTLAMAQDAATEQTGSPAPVATPPQGYSIFAGTMVDMPWPEVEKLANPDTVVIFPTGVVEQHGPHMPLGVDVYLSYNESRLVKAELEARGIPAIIAPPFYWGINAATGSWPGSFTSRPSTVKAVMEDALASLERWGFRNVMILNHHGDPDHNKALLDAIASSRVDTGLRAYFLTTAFNADRWKLMGRKDVLIQRAAPPSGPAPEFVDRHAAGGETSDMAAYFPETIDMDMANNLSPTEVTWDDFQTWLEGWTVSRQMTPQGYVGYPARFSAEQGRTKSETYAKGMAEVIESFLNGSYKPGEVMQ